MLKFTSINFKVNEEGFVYMTARQNNKEGRTWWFCWAAHEWKGFVQGKINAVVDLGHNCKRTTNDHIMFYDMDIPIHAEGEMQVKYIVLHVPFRALRLIDRFLHLPSKLKQDRELEITPQLARRWLRRYGVGKGKVHVQYGEKAKDLLLSKLREEECPKKKTADKMPLRDLVRTWVCMAKGTTTSFQQTAVLRISKDGDGFFLQVLGPTGKRGLVGGLVNHGDEVPSWSSHT